MRKLLTQDPAKNKLVLCGYMSGKTLFRDVKQKHFMRVVNGYGIQDSAFVEIIKRGITKIVLRETDTGQEWESKLQDWIDNSKTADYGHGKQRFLSLKYMSLTKGG